jgi:hypothetical protein
VVNGFGFLRAHFFPQGLYRGLGGGKNIAQTAIKRLQAFRNPHLPKAEELKANGLNSPDAALGPAIRSIGESRQKVNRIRIQERQEIVHLTSGLPNCNRSDPPVSMRLQIWHLMIAEREFGYWPLPFSMALFRALVDNLFSASVPQSTPCSSFLWTPKKMQNFRQMNGNVEMVCNTTDPNT